MLNYTYTRDDGDDAVDLDPQQQDEDEEKGLLQRQQQEHHTVSVGLELTAEETKHANTAMAANISSQSANIRFYDSVTREFVLNDTLLPHETVLWCYYKREEPGCGVIFPSTAPLLIPVVGCIALFYTLWDFELHLEGAAFVFTLFSMLINITMLVVWFNWARNRMATRHRAYLVTSWRIVTITRSDAETSVTSLPLDQVTEVNIHPWNASLRVCSKFDSDDDIMPFSWSPVAGLGRSHNRVQLCTDGDPHLDALVDVLASVHYMFADYCVLPPPLKESSFYDSRARMPHSHIVALKRMAREAQVPPPLQEGTLNPALLSRTQQGEQVVWFHEPTYAQRFVDRGFHWILSMYIAYCLPVFVLVGQEWKVSSHSDNSTATLVGFSIGICILLLLMVYLHIQTLQRVVYACSNRRLLLLTYSSAAASAHRFDDTGHREIPLVHVFPMVSVAYAPAWITKATSAGYVFPKRFDIPSHHSGGWFWPRNGSRQQHHGVGKWLLKHYVNELAMTFSYRAHTFKPGDTRVC